LNYFSFTRCGCNRSVRIVCGAIGNIDAAVDAFGKAAIDSMLWGASMDAAARATGSKGAFVFPFANGLFPAARMSERSVGRRRATTRGLAA